MAVTITFTTIPIGSILTSTIASDEPESKNDFRVRIITSENGTGLTESEHHILNGCEPCVADG